MGTWIQIHIMSREREREREGGTRLKSSHPKSHRGGEERKNIESHKYFKSEFVKYLLVVQSKPFQSQSFKMNNVFDEYFAVDISLASNSRCSIVCRLLPVLDICNKPRIATPSPGDRVMTATSRQAGIGNNKFSQFKSNLHGLGPGKNNRFSFSHNYFIWPNAPPAVARPAQTLNTPLGLDRS